MTPQSWQIRLTVTVQLAAELGERPVVVTTGGLSAETVFTVLSAEIFADSFESGDFSQWTGVVGGS